MKSYKKLNQKAQNLEITPFTMGIRPKIVMICEKSVFFFNPIWCGGGVKNTPPLILLRFPEKN